MSHLNVIALNILGGYCTNNVENLNLGLFLSVVTEKLPVNIKGEGKVGPENGLNLTNLVLFVWT